ncbi:unnamed protein product, partial [Ectocarpus sp. 13 AM-2016]
GEENGGGAGGRGSGSSGRRGGSGAGAAGGSAVVAVVVRAGTERAGAGAVVAAVGEDREGWMTTVAVRAMRTIAERVRGEVGAAAVREDGERVRLVAAVVAVVVRAGTGRAGMAAGAQMVDIARVRSTGLVAVSGSHGMGQRRAVETIRCFAQHTFTATIRSPRSPKRQSGWSGVVERPPLLAPYSACSDPTMDSPTFLRTCRVEEQQRPPRARTTASPATRPA